MLKREDFSKERIDNLIQKAREKGNFEVMTHEERERDRKNVLGSLPPGGDLWVFGYGSLIWNPAIRFVERQPTRLYGFHRSFCLHLTMGRGSPEKPGLMLALDRGGSCNGIAFKIESRDVESETDILWMREMLTGAYRAHWGNLRIAGETVKGLAFVVNRNNSRYTGRLTMEETAQRLITGKGRLGTCRDYITNTVRSLAELKISDNYLLTLCRLMEEKEREDAACPTSVRSMDNHRNYQETERKNK